MGNFFNLDWGDDGELSAERVHKQLRTRDENLRSSISAILLASVVTSRGKRRSPSSVLETLVRSKSRTNPWITDHLRDAWNVAAEQIQESSDRYDVLLAMINPRHRNAKAGVSENLHYQIVSTYESLIDWWAVVADFVTGFRSVSTKVFGTAETGGIGDYLNNGMTRSQLLKSFGHEIRDITDEEDS